MKGSLLVSMEDGLISFMGVNLPVYVDDGLFIFMGVNLLIVEGSLLVSVEAVSLFLWRSISLFM